MSLLNQVLIDLESRDEGRWQGPLRAVDPPGQTAFVDEHSDAERRAGWRLAFGIVLLATVMLTAWAFNHSWRAADSTGPADLSVLRASTLPQAAAPAAAEVSLPVAEAVSSPVAAKAEPEPMLSQPHPVAVVESVESTDVAGVKPDDVVYSTPLASEPPAKPVVSVVIEPPEKSSERSIAKPVEKPIAKRDDEVVDYIPMRNVALPPERTSRSSPAVRKVKSIRPVAAGPLAEIRSVIASGELAQAETLLKAHLGKASRDRDARELLVGLMLRGQRHGEALQVIDTGLAMFPKHAAFALIKARLLAQGGDAQGAIELLENSARTVEIRDNRLQMLGSLYQQQGDYENSTEQYRELLAYQPNNAAAWAGLAIGLDAQADTEALDAYRRALMLGGLPSAATAYAQQRVAELE